VLVSFAEFARIKGVSAPAVTIATKSRIKDAIVERNGKRMLDRDKALSLWDRNTRRNGSERLSDDAKHRDQRALDPAGPEVTTESLKAVIMGLPEDRIPGLDVSRERKAHYDAEVARLDALKSRAQLVLTDDVKQEAARLGRQVRDLLLMIPSRNAAKVATMQDAEEIRSLLQAEIESALRGLVNA
jgi:phage terminase Nu1 subunit (DNA packaging protein)